MSAKQGEGLYFVALVPPEPIFEKVEEIKRELSAEYNTKASLRSPPHVTLHMPFKYKEDREAEIMKALQEVKMDGSFEIELFDFGAFPRRVIYIQVKASESLNILHRKVVETLRREIKVVKDMYKKQGFTPHMTVAFRDLRPAMFDKAWTFIQANTISFKWSVQSFILLKHNGRNWEIFKEFSIT